MNTSHHDNDNDEDAHTHEHVLSSSTIYHIALDASQLPADVSGNSSATHHDVHVFRWLGRDACLSSFICGKLEGNACGDYGVSVAGSDVCLSGDLRRGRVESGETLTVDIWHVRSGLDDEMDISCFLYCTDDGGLPDFDPDSLVDNDFVDELVGTRWWRAH